MTNENEKVKREFDSLSHSKKIILAQVAASKIVYRESLTSGELNESLEMLKSFGLSEPEAFIFIGMDWALEGCPGLDKSVFDLSARKPRVDYKAMVENEKDKPNAG